ncbi:glycosyl transferase family 2 [Candidatus Methylomirabilis lanthanidiphila]|uniref:Glycosyl transferase family 2 n=1 Tax=Candidatus Methylomirabilis lanthanidiphila TaxID=2211376 RepID=A0A564ZIS1_9BACT|nr:glycosyltransferase [Candidatus Methylomirabilis lanthanidiphila]VUZ84986.1 glycosyl transferase family 2 [Candidatus Methylomirabilis lanthanidiphila]
MEQLLYEPVLERLEEIGKADILIGIPSYNNAGTIGGVVKTVASGLATFFPRAQSVIVNSDGGSQDGTPQVVQAALEDESTLLVQHPVPPIYKIITPYHGIPGKGSAFRTIFNIADALQVQACAVVDADLRSITPEWVERLIRPVYEGRFDYVAPLYRRHKYDGTITNSIVYPMTRALYGQQIRQPIGGEFGFSGKLAALYLAKPVWETDVARFGIDIWMTITAAAERYRICQAFLGAKVHEHKDPGLHLSGMLVQVVGSLFSLMEEYANVWHTTQASSPVPIVGPLQEVEVEHVSVNVERMVDAFKQGIRDLLPIWETILASDTLAELRRIAPPDPEKFRFPMDLWISVIYDFALAYHHRVLHLEHLLKALTPLYLGRTASFVLETQESGHQQVEEVIETVAERFEAMKPYLVARWR